MLPRILGTASVFSSTKRISSSFIIMDNCIFCNIIKGKEMTEIIAECDSFVVFRDIKFVFFQVIPGLLNNNWF